MGSWSMTCMLTGLPIDCGTPVLLVPLAEERNGLNQGAASDWTPVLPPIRASYNDYGFIEDIEDSPHARLVRERFGCDDKTFAEMLKEGTLPVQANPYRENKKPRQSFALIRQDAWNELLETAKQSGQWELNPAVSAEAAQWCVHKDEIARKEFKALYPDTGAEINDPQKAKEHDLLRRERFESMLERNPLTGVDPASAFGEWCCFNRPGKTLARGMGKALYLEQLPQTCSNMPEGAALEFAQSAWQALAELEEATLFLHCLRKRWEPAPSGPQFGDTAIHWLWAKKQKDLTDRVFDHEISQNQGDSWFTANVSYQAASALREAEKLGSSTPQTKTRKPKPGV